MNLIYILMIMGLVVAMALEVVVLIELVNLLLGRP